MSKKKCIVGAMICAVLIFAESISAFAMPKYMDDGTVFDAEFYALVNPDVVKVYGTSEEALWKHYMKYGKNEGRFPANMLQYITGNSAAAAITAQ